MGAITITSLSGKTGKILIPTLGTVIGQITEWTLKRRGDDDPKEGLYDLRAALSYLNVSLFNHPEYSKKREIRVQLNSKLSYRIDGGENVRVEGEGRNRQLVIEGVTPWRI